MTAEIVWAIVSGLVIAAILIVASIWLRRRSASAARANQLLHDDPQLRNDMINIDAQKAAPSTRRIF